MRQFGTEMHEMWPAGRGVSALQTLAAATEKKGRERNEEGKGEGKRKERGQGGTLGICINPLKGVDARDSEYSLPKTWKFAESILNRLHGPLANPIR